MHTDGQLIREYRERKGLSQKYVAERLNISESLLQKREVGKSNIYLSDAREVARLLDIPWDEFLKIDKQAHGIIKEMKTEVNKVKETALPKEVLGEVFCYGHMGSDGDVVYIRSFEGDLFYIQDEAGVFRGKSGRLVKMNAETLAYKGKSESGRSLYVVKHISPDAFQISDFALSAHPVRESEGDRNAKAAWARDAERGLRNVPLTRQELLDAERRGEPVKMIGNIAIWGRRFLSLKGADRIAKAICSFASSIISQSKPYCTYELVLPDMDNLDEAWKITYTVDFDYLGDCPKQITVLSCEKEFAYLQ